MVDPNVVEQAIRDGIEGVSFVELEDLTGTKDHYRAVIVSSAFEGKSRVEQHQAVYAALGDLMNGPVHALTFTTFTPEAWERKNGG